MKLWQKICICSLLFFILVFCCSGILMIENNRKTAFDRILQQSADQQTGISSGIMQYIILSQVKESRIEGTYDKEYITEYLSNRINSWGIYLEIRDAEEVLYSNLAYEIPTMKPSEYAGTTASYKVFSRENREYLMLISRIPLKNRYLVSTYIIDISKIYTDTAQQYSFFIKLLLVVSAVLAAGMYLLIGSLTKSLHILTESVKKMGNGNYRERVQIKTRDDVGKLADCYNEMAGAIEEKIRELENKTSELENKTSEQQRFIDNFTHELRTPLTAVVGYADLLRSASFEEAFTQEMGERIFREGKRIEKLSVLMMDLIFLERHSFDLLPCDIREIIREAVQIFEPAAEQARIALNCTLSEQSAVIPAEKDLLLNLLGNLLDNAGKASQPGDQIWVRGYCGGDTVILEVADQGKGIPREDRKKVFERFYMGDKARNGKNSGVGIGLSICADIVKIHNAQIELISEEGQGTTIKIIFPCYK